MPQLVVVRIYRYYIFLITNGYINESDPVNEGRRLRKEFMHRFFDEDIIAVSSKIDFWF